MSDVFNSFTNPEVSSEPSAKEFLQSNGLIAKFIFLMIVIFVFIILFKLGIKVLGYLFKPSNSPRLITGMIDAKSGSVFTQDPSMNSSKTIYRSVNQNDGIEFTWSVWIFIADLQYKAGQYKQVFYKGNNTPQQNGINSPNNAPGLYIAPDTNALVVFMNTYDKMSEEINIPDIPLNKWVNVIIRCQGQILDVYINGTITRSLTLSGIPKQNYGDVYVAMNGGFSGNISNLWYYNYALTTTEISSLVRRGPNTKAAVGSNLNLKNSDYLSLQWYLSENVM
jgi:hypothetical protein